MPSFNWIMRSSKKQLHRTWAVAILSFVLHAIVIGLSLTAIVTTYWVETKVDRKALLEEAESARRLYPTNSSIYFSRHRGIFKTCYTDSDAKDFISSWIGDVTGDCIKEEGFKLKDRTNDDSGDDVFTRRTHILRLLVAFMCLNVALSTVTFIAALISMGRGLGSKLRLVAAFAFGACVVNAGSMVLFQYVNYLEEEEIKHDDFRAGWKASSSHSLLPKHVDVSYGYSYILGWVSFALSVLPPVFYLIIARTLIIRRREETIKLIHRPPLRRMSEKAQARPTSASSDVYYTSSTARNPAYDFIHKERKQSNNMTI